MVYRFFFVFFIIEGQCAGKDKRQHTKDVISSARIVLAAANAFLLEEGQRTRAKITAGKGKQCDKSLVCGICGRVFLYKSVLTQHGLVHTGVKAFICGICKMAFGQKSSRNRHERDNNCFSRKITKATVGSNNPQLKKHREGEDYTRNAEKPQGVIGFDQHMRSMSVDEMLELLNKDGK